jgi:hypothetical protein
MIIKSWTEKSFFLCLNRYSIYAIIEMYAKEITIE